MIVPGYKKINCTCEKCGCKFIVETDYLSESAAKAQHKCKKEKIKSEKGKQTI